MTRGLCWASCDIGRGSTLVLGVIRRGRNLHREWWPDEASRFPGLKSWGVMYLGWSPNGPSCRSRGELCRCRILLFVGDGEPAGASRVANDEKGLSEFVGQATCFADNLAWALDIAAYESPLLLIREQRTLLTPPTVRPLALRLYIGGSETRPRFITR